MWKAARVGLTVLFGMALLILGHAVAPPPPAWAGEQLTVRVFAAASLKDALEEIAGTFEQDTGTKVRLSLAGSSALARQIQNGAPADLYISANVAWMDVLERDGLLAPDSRVDLIGNRLVLIAQGQQDRSIDLSSAQDVSAALGEGRMVMAFVEAVPAGIYGKQALEALGLWSELSGRIAQTDNVRAALALVTAGEAPLGIVYKTDARAAVAQGHAAHIAARFPPGSHDPIHYPAALIAARVTPSAEALLDYLSEAQAQAVFARHGFVPLPE